MGAKRLVLFGAGMTGRGQVAQLAFEDDWDLTLVDRDPSLVELLRREGHYTVRLLGERPRDVRVTGYQVLHTSEEAAIADAMSEANLVVTSVLEPNLGDVGRTLAAALEPRLRSGAAGPINTIAAENMSNSSTVLRGHVERHLAPDLAARLNEKVGFPNSMIARVVPVAQDPLVILAEEYSEWTADRLAAAGDPPRLAGLEWVDNQAARLERKLFIHNTGHAVCGYLGWLAGYRYVHEAAQDPTIMARVAAAIAEAGEAVSRRHGFERESVRAYERNLMGRLVLSALPDDLRRVIRQPIRKLGREERLLGPLALCEEYGLPCEALCLGIAAVLRSAMPGDEQFDRMRAVVDRAGPVPALEELTGYRPGAVAAAAIAVAYRELSDGQG